MKQNDSSPQASCNAVAEADAPSTAIAPAPCAGNAFPVRRKYRSRKQEKREAYGTGSCSPCMAFALDDHGSIRLDDDGAPLKTQERDRFGRPVWLVCISMGVEVSVGEDGRLKRRQRKVQRRVHGSIDDAREAARQLREDCARIDGRATGMTFSDACESWMTSMRNANTCSAAKLRDYATVLDRVSGRLGPLRIATIKGPEIESALVAARIDRNLSQYGHLSTFQLVRRVFAYCVDNEWIVRDPTRNLKSPRVTEEPDRRSLDSRECGRLRVSLDRDEQAAYEALDAKERRRERWGRAPVRSRVLGFSILSELMAVRLMLATGIRRGEALGLTWENVDLPNRQITVRQSLNAQMMLKSPKTRRGVRTISIDADTADHLRRLKKEQARFLQHLSADGAAGSSTDGNAGGKAGGRVGSGTGGKAGSRAHPVEQTGKTPVCCSCTGGMLDPSKCSRWWREYRAAIGFPELRLHELRHTQATMLLGHGVSVKDVQARLGHASASLTLDVYGHAIPANDRKAANLMGAIYGPSKR